MHNFKVGGRSGTRRMMSRVLRLLPHWICFRTESSCFQKRAFDCRGSRAVTTHPLERLLITAICIQDKKQSQSEQECFYCTSSAICNHFLLRSCFERVFLKFFPFLCQRPALLRFRQLQQTLDVDVDVNLPSADLEALRTMQEKTCMALACGHRNLSTLL
eukprot:565806-Amphidinium_carterae.1